MKATVVLASPARGIARTVTTDGAGYFAAPQLPSGSYTITVESPGLKKVVRTDVLLTAANQLGAGRFVLEDGAGTATPAAGAAPIDLQSTSGERSGLLTNVEIRDLSLNGRNMLDLLVVLPGVLSRVNGEVSGTSGLNLVNINGTRGNQTELTIDGSSNVDTSTNGALHVTINPDAVDEVRVLAANYQAEYGRAAGGYVQFITKSGTSDFHGTARFFHRNEKLNANNYFRNAEGRNPDGSQVQPRPLYRYDYSGYDIGGPVQLGRWNEGRNKLFFYWNQEFYRQLVASATTRNILVPTAAERRGDFSETVDGAGNKIFIRDPNRSGTCSASDQTACFPGNIIPPDRFFRDGQAILNLYPLPNFAGENRFNYTSSLSADYPRREDIVRIDYNISERTRLMGRYINNADSQLAPYGAGNFLLSRVVSRSGGQNGMISLSHVFRSGLTNEFIFGPSAGRNTRDAEDDKATRGAAKITFPLLFSNVVDSSPIPNFTYSGIANVTNYPTANFANLPTRNVNYTFDFADNLTKVWGRHAIKTGIFVQRSRNDRTANTPVGANIVIGAGPPNHPFASALLGLYSTYQQASGSPQALFRYTNAEGYVQDNWRVTPRLTVDYGLRLSWFQPQYDARLQTGVFSPDLYDPSKAVRLYEPVCLVSTGCNPGSANLRAVDPANAPSTPTIGNTFPLDLIGLIVPGSGVVANGIGRASQGYPRGGFDSRGVQWGPRLGFAYDPFGGGRTVVRGGFGISYDRIAGEAVSSMLLNPPTTVTSFIMGNPGRLQELATVGVTLAPADVFGASRDGKIPSVYSASLGLQRDVGSSTVIDIAYVGTLSRHLPQLRNLNATPFGTFFTREAQDPTRFSGGVVPDVEQNLPAPHRQAGFAFSGAFTKRAEFLRPFRDYASVLYREFAGSANYHSLQVAANRRFSHGLQFSASYTWSKALGTGATDNEVADYDNRRRDYRLLAFDRRHLFGMGYVYNIPNAPWLGGNRLTRAIFDNWQISGISTLISGVPTEVLPNVVPGGVSRIAGSNTQPFRLYLSRSPQPGPNGLQVDPGAFVIPSVGDAGPWPRQYLRGPGTNNHNLSFFKNLPFDGKSGRYLQLRFEMFNAFNHTQFNSINLAANLAVPDGSGGFLTGLGPVLNDYSRAVITSNLRPAGSTEPLGRFFGEYNGASSARIIQLGLKVYF